MITTIQTGEVQVDNVLITQSQEKKVQPNKSVPNAPATAPPATETTTQTQQPPGFFSFDIASGMNKVCFYDQLGSLSAKTIGRAEICPLGY